LEREETFMEGHQRAKFIRRQKYNLKKGPGKKGGWRSEIQRKGGCGGSSRVKKANTSRENLRQGGKVKRRNEK